MIDEPLYQKHQNAITTSQHTEISVEYAIKVLEDLKKELSEGEIRSPVVDANIKIKQLKALLK